MRKAFLPLLMILASVCSCADRSLYQQFDSLESIIFDHPDSVLKALEKIDTSLLRTDAMKARYSLLHATALDKNYIDTTDVSLIMPAVEYYKKKGTPEQKLKVFYQLGRIQYNAGDLNNAALSFTLSEREAAQTTDEATKGLLYMTFSEIYNRINNSEKELEYIKRGINAFKSCGDIGHASISDGRLAVYYLSQQQWEKADSLFKAGITMARKDSMVTALFLSYYSKMKVLQSNPDPNGAVTLLEEKHASYHQALSLEDYGVYAYAAALNRDFKVTDMILDSLRDQGLIEDSALLFYRSQIEALRDNYPDAIALLSRAYDEDLKEINLKLSHSVAQSLQDYYARESETIREKERNKLFFMGAGSLIAIMLVITLLFYSRSKSSKKQHELDRLLNLAEESNRLLQSDLMSISNQYEESVFKQKRLRERFVEIYKERFTPLGDLCKTYFSVKDRPDKQEVIFRRVESLIGFINSNEKLHAEFESQIDKDLNNIVSNITRDLKITDDEKRHFICYIIAGFEPRLISDLLGISLANYYTKKSRLKDRIELLDSPHKEEYLRFF